MELHKCYEVIGIAKLTIERLEKIIDSTWSFQELSEVKNLILVEQAKIDYIQDNYL